MSFLDSSLTTLSTSPSPLPNNSEDRPKVLIIYTGGTMGMRPLPDGSLAPVAGYLTEKIKEMPELSLDSMPAFDIIEFNPLLDSSCMGPPDWRKIATHIEDRYNDYAGFVVIMGTDTMSYASSALSFMFENLTKPIIFTGSQIPFCEVYNDARRNLIISILFAANGKIPEVCLCFNDKLMRANRTVKIDSMSLDAFHSPNFPPLATLGANINENFNLFLNKSVDNNKHLIVHKNLDSHVLVVKLIPGFDDEAIKTLILYSKTLRAIVFELYGSGNGPSNKKTFIETLLLAKERKILLVALSQCLKGGVALGAYTMGREFQQAGVISGGDMTTEACTTKLAYLFALYGDNEDIVAKKIKENLRGEISPDNILTNQYFKKKIPIV